MMPSPARRSGAFSGASVAPTIGREVSGSTTDCFLYGLRQWWDRKQDDQNTHDEQTPDRPCNPVDDGHAGEDHPRREERQLQWIVRRFVALGIHEAIQS